jgi:hypothetical protein
MPIEGTSARQSRPSANKFRSLDLDLPKSRTIPLSDTAGVSRPVQTEQPQIRFRPWAHSSMDCLMQQHPFQKLLDLSIGIRLGKQSHVFRCFTK